MGGVDPATGFCYVGFEVSVLATKGESGPFMPREKEELEVGEGPKERGEGGFDFAGPDWLRGKSRGRMRGGGGRQGGWIPLPSFVGICEEIWRRPPWCARGSGSWGEEGGGGGRRWW